MAEKINYKARVADVFQKLIYAGVIALAVFLFKINSKVNSIGTNEKKIEILRQEHAEDKNVLHQRATKNGDKINDVSHKVSALEATVNFLMRGGTP